MKMKKRGSLGSTEVNVYEYWTDGKSSHELKCNETILYSEIDLCQTQAQYSKTQKDLQSNYSRMDLMYMCIKAIEFCGSDDETLRCAGAIIGNMKSEGCFSIDFDTIEDENRYLDGLVAELSEKLDERGSTIPILDEEFDAWFEANVVAYNYYETPNGKSKVITPELLELGRLSGSSNDQYSAKMKDSAMSLMYYGANKKNLYEGCSNEDEMASKVYTQGQTINWFATAGTNMTTQSIKNCIKSGIMDKTEGLSQEEAIDRFRNESVDKKNGRTNGLGDAIAIITLIVTAISVIAGLISSILKARAQSRQAYDFQQDQDAPWSPECAPNEDDWVKKAKESMQDMLDGSSSLTTGEVIAVASIAGIGIIGAIIMLFSSGKKKENE